MKYWKDGFYDEPQSGTVEITEEYWLELLDGQSQGLHIINNEKDFPVLTECVPADDDIRQARIAELKALLANTDYQALKVADGAMTQQEYEPVRTQRVLWRAEINELQ